MVPSLEEPNNTENLENGKLSNVLLRYHMTGSAELTSFEPVAPQYNVSVNSKPDHPPPGDPQGFVRSHHPGGRVFVQLSLPGGRGFELEKFSTVLKHDFYMLHYFDISKHISISVLFFAGFLKIIAPGVGF